MKNLIEDPSSGPVIIGVSVAVQLLGGALVYVVVQQASVTAVICVASRDRRYFNALRTTSDGQFVELTTICLGIMVAAVVSWNPIFATLVVAPLLALSKSALVRELNRAVERDGRTGLLTSDAWHSQAEQMLSGPTRRGRMCRLRARHESTPSSVIGVLMVDVDHFKLVNDTYGHAVGDRVLQQVAHTLRSAVRSADLVARYGGEEFLVLLVDTGEE